MKKSKVKICKYPKCKKEVHSNKALFCMEHSRDLKDKRKAAVGAIGSVALMAGASVVKAVQKKKY